MRIIRNAGSDRVIDELRQALVSPCSLSLASPVFSLFAFAGLRERLAGLETCRMVLGASDGGLALTGSDADRAFRNRLNLRWLAKECSAWIEDKVDVRRAPRRLPQSVLIAGSPDGGPKRVITGNCSFSTGGLGITPAINSA